LKTEIWVRGIKNPFIFERAFARSQEPDKNKQRFINQFDLRKFDENFLLICGELNIVKYDRIERQVVDRYEIIDRLKGTSLVVAPWHTRA